MNLTSKRTFAAVAAAALVIGSVATTSAHAASYKIYIGYQGPLTGDNKQTGLDEIAGVKFALAKYNAMHKTAQVGLKEIDDQGSGPGASVVAPGTAKDKSIVAIVGPAFSGASVASFPYYRAAGLPLISPSATRVTLTDPTVTSDFGGPVFHRIPSKDDKQGPALAHLAVKGVTAPVVYSVNDQSSYGTGLDKYVQIALKAASGVTVAGDDAVDGTNTTLDFSATISKITAAKANVVIYSGYYAQAAGFVKQLRNANYKGIFASGDGTYDSGFVSGAGSAAEGARLTASSAVFSDAGPAITADFTKTTGNAPGTYATEDYDAANILLTCISKGNTTRPKILSCIKAGTFKGLMGNTIKFDANGDVSGNGFINSFVVTAGDIKSTGQVK
jgi:branched-chain amino acid transport system substrate-binding protein